MRNKGKINGRQVLPAEVVSNILKGGDTKKFAKAGYTQLSGWSYRSM